jgi:hypothetical protein
MDFSLLQPVTWACIHFIPKREFAHLKAPSYEESVVLRVRLNGSDKSTLLKALGDVFQFPDRFGNNWDALNDMLCDLSWLPARRYVLFLENASPLWRENILDAGVLVDIWLAAAEWWSRRGVSFHLVFVVDV